MPETVKQLKAIDLGCIRQHKALFTSISFELTAGSLLLIEGANGSGKSSLLRLLSGLTSPSYGDVHWCGQPIADVRHDYWESLHYVSHSNGIKLGLTVAENLQLISCLAVTTTQTDQQRILSLLQLQQQSHTPVSYLSAGQKRRLALAKLFLLPKTLWLLDEPLTALDNQTQSLFLNQLKEHLHDGGMCVMSSHHPLSLNGIAMRTMRLATC